MVKKSVTFFDRLKAEGSEIGLLNQSIRLMPSKAYVPGSPLLPGQAEAGSPEAVFLYDKLYNGLYGDGGRPLGYRIQRFFQILHRPIDVFHFIQPEKAEPEGAETFGFTAFQGDPRSNLEPLSGKLFAGTDLFVVGITNYNSGGFKSGGGHTGKPSFSQKGSYLCTEFQLSFPCVFQTKGLNLTYGITQAA